MAPVGGQGLVEAPCHGSAPPHRCEPGELSGHGPAPGTGHDQAEVPGRAGHELPCHGPALAWNDAQLQEKVLEIVDMAMALSRATLEQKIPALVRACGPIPETSGTKKPACHGPPSLSK